MGKMNVVRGGTVTGCCSRGGFSSSIGKGERWECATAFLHAIASPYRV
jgi:hypothetical protein